MNGVRYPEVNVKLTGRDGNAFSILGRVRGALRSADVPEDEVARFVREATSGDYEDLLVTVMRWVDVQ